ncbi:MAG: Uma2 family endonuclease [Labilithrix sp.]|nr:Uma2 family endonuclease [Labilithrix sp.]
MLPFVAARPSPFTAPVPEPDGRVLIHNVSWEAYVSMSETLGRSGSRARLTYLEGALEIMTNSRDHELLKKLLARLLEAWADERSVELEGYGSTTFRKEAKERGLEPDECYSVGEMQDVPDIAIEVVVSSGLLDKLEVYRGLGVLEVWVFERSVLTVYRLVDGVYRAERSSEVLPALDLAHLASFVRLDAKQSLAVRTYRAELRERDA